MADRVAIFIDGAYLEYMLKDEFKSVPIDFQAFSKAMAGSADILRTYYYHCPPYQSSPPTEEERQRYAARRKFYTAIDRLPRFTVRLGRLALRGVGTDGTPSFEQKRVDILLGVDMTQLAVKGQIQQAELLAGDSDFIPAVTVAKNEGILVRLFRGGGCHSDLWQEVDERVRIDQTFIDSVTKMSQTRLPLPSD
ncbi:MAG: NYN domain-containing protein [Chloroflexi bacterium]|nr:NYN domain-containing protein [Chloroflexota bacterium]